MTERKTEDGMPALNIALALNTGGTCATKTLETFLINIIRFLSSRQDKCLVNYIFVEAESSNPSRASNMLCKQLIELDYDYVFFFDLDIVMPPNLLTDLIENAEKKNLDIVCGWAYQKDFPPKTNLLLREEGGYAVITEIGTKELFEVDATGPACMLLRKGVIESIEPPWFQDSQGNFKEGDTFVGPDIRLCEKFKKAGYKIWIDPNLRCGHIGRYVF